MASPQGKRDSAFYVLSGGLIIFACLDALAFSYAAKSVPSLFLSLFANVLGVPVYFFCYWFFEKRHSPGQDPAGGTYTPQEAVVNNQSSVNNSALMTDSLDKVLLSEEGFTNSIDAQHHQNRSTSDDGSRCGGSICCLPHALRDNFAVLVFFGLLSALSNAMVIIGASHTAGGMQALLYQLVIPFNLVLSATILKYRASWFEYAGAFVVLCGIVVVYLPQILPGKNAEPIDGTTVLFNLIYAAGIVPSSLSSILTERAIKTWDGVTVLGFVAWLQLVSLPLTLVTIPLYTLSLLGDYRVAWSEIGGSYRDGWRCLAYGGDDVEVELACKWGLLSSVLAVCSNAGISVVALHMIQRYSASSMVLVAALSLPVTEMVFNIPGLADEPNWTWELFVGLALIVGGNTIYRRSKGARKGHRQPANDVDDSGQAKAHNQGQISEGEDF